MSIRTTVTLDEDAVDRLKQEARSKGIPFHQALNDTLRVGLLASRKSPQVPAFTSYQSIWEPDLVSTTIVFQVHADILEVLAVENQACGPLRWPRWRLNKAQFSHRRIGFQPISAPWLDPLEGNPRRA